MASWLTQWVSDSHAGHRCPSNRFLWRFSGLLGYVPLHLLADPRRQKWRPLVTGQKEGVGAEGNRGSWGEVRQATWPPLFYFLSPQDPPLHPCHHVQITFSRAATRSPSPSFWWSMECSTPSWSWSWRPRGGEGLRERQAPGHRCLECGAQAPGNTPSTPHARHRVSAPTSTAPHYSSPGEPRSCLCGFRAPCTKADSSAEPGLPFLQVPKGYPPTTMCAVLCPGRPGPEGARGHERRLETS